MDLDLQSPLELPCGVTIPNRIAKAAMTEGLADPEDAPTEAHATLYGRWSDGGAGLLVTGNVMIDRRYLERPGNVVLDPRHEDAGAMQRLTRWAEAGTRGGNQLFMQLNHPGRQCARMTTTHPVGPSDLGINVMGLFAKPRALRVPEIWAAVRGWAYAAKMAQAAGFTGVQVHSAHGYLLSQFLSPIANLRTDEWGGPLQNRARLLLEVVRAVREAVGDEFPISVKLNSSDFQKGGFTSVESSKVAEWLVAEKVDLLEISGGTYESLAFMGDNLNVVENRAESTRRREAFFLDYARTIREAAPDLPMMVTGGFRSAAFMRDALRHGEVDLIGIARPFCGDPAIAAKLISGEVETLRSYERGLRLGPGFLGPSSGSRQIRSMNNQAEVAWFYANIVALSQGESPDLGLGAWSALFQHVRGEMRRASARVFRDDGSTEHLNPRAG